MNIIIIKLGYSETLLPDAGLSVSLGDVLRSTPVLPALKEQYCDSRITWIVAPQARPLLENNPFIDRLLTWEEWQYESLSRESFDILINLEKVPEICLAIEEIQASRRFGFSLNHSGGYAFHSQSRTLIRNSTEVVQKMLIEILGCAWKEQEYILGYTPRGCEIHDIGLNYKAGPKLPTKELSIQKWEQLAAALTVAGFKVVWQKGFNDLYQYMEWIHSCALLITTDSLGLHLALALRKRVLGLFGPTDPKEIFFYNRGQYLISSAKCDYMPCYREQCVHQGEFCMDQIKTTEIIAKVKELWPTAWK